MSNRHDEGFGSGFGIGYDPMLDWEGQAIRGGVFRDSIRGRRYHLDDEMSGSWNGRGGMTDRFYDRHVGYGHPYERGIYGHPYERNFGFQSFYGHPYERNVGFQSFYGPMQSSFYGHPYERNVGFQSFERHPYERSAFYTHPLDRTFVTPSERSYVHHMANTLGMTPWEVQRNIALFGTPNVGMSSGIFNTPSAFQSFSPFHTSSFFGTTPFEQQRNLALFGHVHPNSVFGMNMNPFFTNAFAMNNVFNTNAFGMNHPFEQQRNLALFGTPFNPFQTTAFQTNPFQTNAFHTSSLFGMTPFEQQRNIALLQATQPFNAFHTNTFNTFNPFNTFSPFQTSSLFGTTPFEQQRNIALLQATNGMLNVNNVLANGILGNNVLGNNMLTNNVLTNTLLANQLLGNNVLGNNVLGNNVLGNNILGNNILGNNSILGNSVLANSLLGHNVLNNVVGMTSLFGTTPFERNLALFGTNAGIGFNTHSLLNNTLNNTSLLGMTPVERNIALFGTPFVSPVERQIAERNIALFGTPFVSPVERQIAERNIALFGTPFTNTAFNTPFTSTSPFGVGAGVGFNSFNTERHPHDRGFFGHTHAGFSPFQQHGFYGSDRDVNDVASFGARTGWNTRFGRTDHDGIYADGNVPFSPFASQFNSFNSFNGVDGGFGFGDDRAPFYGRGPKGYKRPDERIREEVAELISRQGFIDASDVEVNVENGVVRLVGSVAQRRDKRGLEYLIERIHGVDEIRNELRLNHNPSSERFQNRIVDRSVVPPNGKNARA